MKAKNFGCHSFPNGHTVNVLKFQTLLDLFLNKMLVIRAGIHNMPDRIADREDPDQMKKQSDLGLPRLLWQAGLTLAQNLL